MSGYGNRQVRSYSFSILLITVALTLAGLMAIPSLIVRDSSAPNPGIISVWFANGSLSARSIEQEITSRIESISGTVQGIAGTSSQSSEGSGWVNIYLKDHADISATRFEISLRLRQIRPHLPGGTSIGLSGGSSEPDVEEIMNWTVLSDLPDSVTDSICMRILTDHVLGIPGIGKILYQGNIPLSETILFDPATVSSSGIEISDALRNQPQALTLGSARIGNEQVPVGLSYIYPRLGDQQVRNSAGRFFRLKDIAVTSEGTGYSTNISRINGLESGSFSIYPTSQGNTIRICRTVRKELAKASANYPDGFIMECSSDMSGMIVDGIMQSAVRSAASMLILIAILMAVYRNRRFVAVIIASLVSDISVTALICRIAGIGIDLGTLSALTVSMGMLIDTSIVMACDYIAFRNRKSATGILTAVMTTVASLVLVFVIPEGERRELDGFIYSTAISLTVSFIVAWISVPAMMETFHVCDSGKRPDRAMLRRVIAWECRYRKAITLFTRYRAIMAIFFLLLAAYSAIACFSQYSWQRASGHSVSTELRVSAISDPAKPSHVLDGALSAMERRIALFPQVERFRTQGFSNQGTIRIQFRKGIRTDEKTEIRDSIWNYALHIPEVAWTVPGIAEGQDTYSTDFNRQEWSDNITLRGYDYDILLRYAGMAIDSLKSNSRVRGAAISADNSYNQSRHLMRFHPDTYHDALNGIGVRDYVYALSRQGITYSGTPFSGQQRVLIPTSNTDAGVWMAMNWPLSIGDRAFRLGNAGDMAETTTTPSIVKENQEYITRIDYNYIGDDLGHYAMVSKIISSISGILPFGFHIGTGFDNAGGEKGRSAALLVMAVLAMIFLICCAMFNSIRISLAIISLIPVSISGIFTLYGALGIRPDQSCFASIVMTSGLAVNSGIYIAMEYLHRLRPGKSQYKSIVRAFGMKIAPTALTIISTVLGLAPFLFTDDTYGFWFLLSAGIMAGLVFSCAGLLILFPSIISLKKQKINDDNPEKTRYLHGPFKK